MDPATSGSPPRKTLKELVALAHKGGWASATGTVSMVQFHAGSASLDAVGGRSGAQGPEALRPVEPHKAPKRSLSSKYGTGAQPLHTDGAHLAYPPDIVVLCAASASDVPTMLFRVNHQTYADELRDALASGLFTVDDGQHQFLAPARTPERVRFDPGCMNPVDARSRYVAKYFAGALESATRFDWTQENQVLVIDNRKVLHARADAADEPDRELQRLMFRIRSTDRGRQR